MPHLASRSTSSERSFSRSYLSAAYTISSESLQPRVDPRCGSQGDGAACDTDPENPCCSQYGYCGNTSDYCQISQGCQSGCTPTGFLPSSNITSGRCGSSFGDSVCMNSCCSKNGYCGTTDEYCLLDNGCQSGCTSTATNTLESLPYPARIGIITVIVVLGVSLLFIGLYVVWRCRNRSHEIIDQETNFESEVSSISNSRHAGAEATTQSLDRLCVECLQTKSILAAFPSRRITAGCDHEPRVCRWCIEISINTSIIQHGCDQIRCPERGCNAELEEADIQEFARLDDFQQYQRHRQRGEFRECQICVEDKAAATEFPSRSVTAQCRHVSACKECIASTIRAAIDEGRWTNIDCPLCPNQLDFKDIAEFAASEDFARYDRLLTRRAMQEVPGFRWCLREGCNSGQIHIPGEQIMLCFACGYEMCYVHQVPWHTGITCQEYEIQNARRRKVEEEAVRAVIRSTTTPCPNCKVNVEKVEQTCNHMICRPPGGCRHEFCYECLVRWTGYGRRTRHKPTCSSYVSS